MPGCALKVQALQQCWRGCSWQKYIGLRCGMLQLSSEIKIERKNASHTISHSPMETKSLLRERYHVHPRKGEGDWQLPMLTATSSSNASGATQSHHSWPVQHQICIHQLASLKPAAWHRFGQRHTCQENRAEHCRRQMWQYDLQKCTPSAVITVEGWLKPWSTASRKKPRFPLWEHLWNLCTSTPLQQGKLPQFEHKDSLVALPGCHQSQGTQRQNQSELRQWCHVTYLLINTFSFPLYFSCSLHFQLYLDFGKIKM